MPLGPGYWLSSITGLQKGRIRRFRNGRIDRWFVTVPIARHAYLQGLSS